MQEAVYCHTMGAGRWCGMGRSPCEGAGVIKTKAQSAPPSARMVSLETLVPLSSDETPFLTLRDGDCNGELVRTAGGRKSSCCPGSESFTNHLFQPGTLRAPQLRELGLAPVPWLIWHLRPTKIAMIWLRYWVIALILAAAASVAVGGQLCARMSAQNVTTDAFYSELHPHYLRVYPIAGGQTSKSYISWNFTSFAERSRAYQFPFPNDTLYVMFDCPGHPAL